MSEARSLYRPEWLTQPENPADLSRSIWTDSFTRNAEGELCIDGVTVSELAAEHGTPQYVFSETTFRARARAYRTAFERAFAKHGAQVSVYYAGKSFLSTAVVRWVREEGLCLDTASGGELALALRGGMPGERIALHGNNKSEAEIARAIRNGLGRVVADSVDEIKLIERVYAELAAERVAEGEEPYPPVPVLIRITPGVHASTHESIATAHEDQKFGLSVHGGAARQTIDAIIAAPELELHGLHSHIGSQILDLAGFREAVGIVLTLRHEVAVDTGHLCPEVDLGGGYGIAYTGADPVPPGPAQVARTLAEAVRETCERLGDEVPTVSIEPGRAVAGPTTVTLYTITGLKRVELGEGASRLYVSIDGGMSDNIRPALYEAAYTALVANRRPDPQAGLVRSRVVGKHCESGDVVVRDVDLPADLAVGDVLAVPATGAYGRSMASNYNLFTRPGVRWVREGESGWVLRPETIEDLVRLEG